MVSKINRVAIVFFAFVGLAALANHAPKPTAPVRSNVPAVEDNTEAKFACWNKVRATAKYPSKADLYATTLGERKTTAGWVFFGKVDMMNDFGAMIPHRFVCTEETGSVDVHPE